MKNTLRDLVAPSMTRREARAALYDAGWSFVGGGSFASVWGSPDGKRVAKVTKPDEGSEETYRLSVADPDNKYLPTYFDRVPLANGGAVYEVERLKPFTGWDDWEAATDGADNDPAFSDTIELLRSLTEDYDDESILAYDDHWRNAMQRPDGTIVLTDYLADYPQLANATVSGGEHDMGVNTSFGRGGSNHYADVEFR